MIKIIVPTVSLKAKTVVIQQITRWQDESF